ncbi:MAG: efflux RND transporter periplasmic adaptor subunit [Legionellaceae bacterium]|nr:efflux RND transporter periplasmic adaptor subunit [Legionellaceae bacterium]
MKIPAMLSARYASLSDDQKKIAIISVVFSSLFFMYLLFHWGHILVLKHNQTPVPPMLIRHEKKIEIPVGSSLRTKMQIATVQSTSVPHTLSFPGLIESDPSTTVNILPPMAGRIMTLNVGLGDKVDVNQILAVISSPDLAQAYSDNEKAVSALSLASNMLKRTKEIRLIGGNSVQDVQQVENNYLQAELDVKRTAARLKTLGTSSYDALTIRSPIPGQVTSINYGIGSYVNDATVALMTISDIKTVLVTANISENDVGEIEKGQDVDITLPAFPHQTWHGNISFVNSFLEPDTRTNKTRIVLPNPSGKIQPNMFANVKVNVKQPSQVMIPISSVLMNNDTTSVYVEVSPWICERRDVQLGAEDGEHVRVLSGLRAGERVVVCGGVFIND